MLIKNDKHGFAMDLEEIGRINPSQLQIRTSKLRGVVIIDAPATDVYNMMIIKMLSALVV